MSYLKAFILANWKQAANTGLSIAALVLFIKHPEWKAYIGMGALTLAGCASVPGTFTTLNGKPVGDA